MKKNTLIFALSVFIALATGSVASAQDPTNFPMVGIARGQTLLLNLVAFPPNPCMAQAGFESSTGAPVGPSQAVTLAPGQSVSLALNGNSLTSAIGQRVEVLPTVVPAPAAVAANACVATAEVIDNLLGVTMVLVPGAVGFPPAPVFGMLGVTLLQTVRLNVVAYPPTPCIGQIGFADKNGNQIGTPMAVDLSPGQATFLDLPGNTLVNGLGQRAEVNPVVTVTSSPAAVSACVASAEVYDNGIGITAVYFPPSPCSPSSTSCVVF